jgi:hypothetical protein
MMPARASASLLFSLMIRGECWLVFGNHIEMIRPLAIRGLVLLILISCAIELSRVRSFSRKTGIN